MFRVDASTTRRLDLSFLMWGIVVGKKMKKKTIVGREDNFLKTKLEAIP